MKAANGDKLQRLAHQVFHRSCDLSQPARMCSDGADHPHNRDDQSDTQADRFHDQSNEYVEEYTDGNSFLHLNLQALHGNSPQHYDGNAALRCSPHPQAHATISDDHMQLLHRQAFHGSCGNYKIAAAPHCSLLTQGFSAQENPPSREANTLQGSSSFASYEAAGLHESCTKHVFARSLGHTPRVLDTQEARFTDDQAEQNCEDIQCTTLQATGEEDGCAPRSRSSLAQAFATEDYNDFLVLLSQSNVPTKPLSALVSEESHKHSSFMHSFNASNNPSKEPNNYFKLCSSSSKYPIIKEQYNNSYIMRGVGLAFKWRPTISTFKFSSLFGGQLINKTSSARVWVQEDDSSSCNNYMDAKLSTYTPHLCPHFDIKPFFTSNSFHKPITRDEVSGNSAKCNPPSRNSPLADSEVKNISTRKDSPTLTRFSSSLGSSLPGSANCYSGSASFNSGTSSTNAGRSTRRGSLCSSRNGFCLAGSSFTSFDHRSKLADDKIKPPHHEPKLRRLQSLLHGKTFNMHLFSGKTKLNHKGTNLPNEAYCKNPRYLDRNCNASSFHNIEELSKESIQGAIAHCKQSMANTNHSNAFVLS